MIKIKKTFHALMAVLTIFAFSFGIAPSADAATFGTEHLFSGSNRADHTNVAALDATHFVVAYHDTVVDDGVAVACHITGADTVSCGTPVEFNDGNTGEASISAIDSTRFVIAYTDPGNSNYGTAIVGQVSSDTVVSFGAENPFTSVSTTAVGISVAALSSTRFVAVYTANGYRVHAIVGAMSGTTIDYYGTAEDYYGEPWTNRTSVVAMDSSNFVVAYQTNSNPINGYVAAGSVSDTTITEGDSQIFNAGLSADLDIDNLDDTHFVVVYKDNSESDKGTAIVGTRAGTVITVNESDKEAYYSLSSSPNSVTALDSGRFVVTSKDHAVGRGWTRTGSVSGTTITYYGSEATDIYNPQPPDAPGSSFTAEMSIDFLSGNDFVVTYRDHNNLDLGTMVLGNEQQGGNGGAIPEYTTPIAIALALGAGFLVILIVRSRYRAKKKV